LEEIHPDINNSHTFRSGFVAIMGIPNVGKSTLLNRIMGGHFAIVTEKPQTTRTVIRAIKNMEYAQIIFIDTPGIHTSQKAFNKILIQSAKNACKEADAILALVPAQQGHEEDNAFLFSLLEDIPGTPKIIALNKIDRISKEQVENLMQTMAETLPGRKVYPISALKGWGIKEMLAGLVDLLPESPPLFPQDMETDMTERFFASEIIREKVFLLAKEEIPYEIAVEIEQFKEDEEKNMIVISAVIHVNRESQKRIIVGKNGELIKRIGILARKDLEVFFQIHVYLELWVRVSRNWMKNSRMLKELGIIAG
jgi:GTP-binding protein Era